MHAHTLTIRAARRGDLPAIVRMLADDELGRKREAATDPLPDSYYAAFDEIERDPNNLILVAVQGDVVVGTLQLTYTPSLSYRGGWRATVESVRTDAEVRGQGIGRAMMEHAIGLARAQGCVLMQLSTHQSRTDAHRFYQRLGFKAEHLGMKLMLKD
ncbi:MAG TPA: GNAT family N-acetyltransferase [Longimicrobiales bacterium]